MHSKIKYAQPGDHEALKVELSVRESLDALQTSKVETMFLHIPDRQTPFEETLKVMNEGVRQRKFTQYGISNHTAAEVQDIISICERNGYAKPAVFQGHYNAIVRGGEKELFPLLRKNSIPFFAYRYVFRNDAGPFLTSRSVLQPEAYSPRQPQTPTQNDGVRM